MGLWTEGIVYGHADTLPWLGLCLWCLRCFAHSALLCDTGIEQILVLELRQRPWDWILSEIVFVREIVWAPYPLIRSRCEILRGFGCLVFLQLENFCRNEVCTVTERRNCILISWRSAYYFSFLFCYSEDPQLLIRTLYTIMLTWNWTNFTLAMPWKFWVRMMWRSCQLWDGVMYWKI